MAFLYPRKQTVIISIVCILAVGAAIYANQGFSKASGQADVDKQVIADVTAPVAPTSTASDWRKQFAVDAATGTAKSSSKSANGSSDQILTQTDALGRQLFTQYAALKQANLLDDADSVNQAVSSLASTYVQGDQAKTYTLNDLTIYDSVDTARLQSFASGVIDAINLFSMQKTEAMVMQEYMNGRDPSVLTQLNPIIATYKKIISRLTAMPVPRSLSDKHVALLNAMSTLQFAAESLRFADGDPVRSMTGIRSHMDGVQMLIEAIVGMNNALKTYGIEFHPDQTSLQELIS